MTTVTSTADADLVALAIQSDQRAWNELVQRYTRLVWHVVLGFHQLDVATQADVHQTTWLRLAEQLDRIKNPDRLGTWLATTARRECIRLLAQHDRETPLAEIDRPPNDDPLDRHLLDSERDADLWVAFQKLDERGQALIRLLLADPPFSYDDIAELLDMKRGSIGPTRQRCLDALRAELNRTTKDLS